MEEPSDVVLGRVLHAHGRPTCKTTSLILRTAPVFQYTHRAKHSLQNNRAGTEAGLHEEHTPRGWAPDESCCTPAEANWSGRQNW